MARGADELADDRQQVIQRQQQGAEQFNHHTFLSRCEGGLQTVRGVEGIVHADVLLPLAGRLFRDAIALLAISARMAGVLAFVCRAIIINQLPQRGLTTQQIIHQLAHRIARCQQRIPSGVHAIIRDATSIHQGRMIQATTAFTFTGHQNAAITKFSRVLWCLPKDFQGNFYPVGYPCFAKNCRGDKPSACLGGPAA